MFENQKLIGPEVPDKLWDIGIVFMGLKIYLYASNYEQSDLRIIETFKKHMGKNTDKLFDGF